MNIIKSFALFSLGIILIAVNSHMSQYTNGNSINIGLLFIVNYYLLKNSQEFFTYLIFVILCTIQDSYSNNIPFTIVLSLIASSKLISGLVKVIKKNIHLQETNSEKTINIFLFYICYNVIVIFIGKSINKSIESTLNISNICISILPILFIHYIVETINKINNTQLQ